VIEACALGLPVVSTAVGGVPDLLADGVDGLLVPDDDDAAMASAVARIVDDAALAERLSADGLALAERSHWSRVVPMWHELLTSVGGHAVRGRS
jgi:glycosyltransferase involved in cell wall biosynthesis